MTSLEHPIITLSVEIVLRTAIEDDLPKLEWYGQYQHFRNLFRRTFREQQAGRRLMLLADLNGFPIGHVFIQMKQHDHDVITTDSSAYFYSFRVMEMFRGQGIGTRLLGEAEAQVRARGFYWANIAVAKDNPDALRLYERLSYHIFGEDAGAWSYTDHRGRLRQVREPCWLLRKRLRKSG